MKVTKGLVCPVVLPLVSRQGAGAEAVNLLSAAGWGRQVPAGSRDSDAPPGPCRSQHTQGPKWHVPAMKSIKAALDSLILSRQISHNVKTKHHLQAMS